MSALFPFPDPWPLCGPCGDFPPRHDECQGGTVLCECFVELLIEAEERPVTEPAPEQTDNRERPEDGEQDVSQDADLDYSDPQQ